MFRGTHCKICFVPLAGKKVLLEEGAEITQALVLFAVFYFVPSGMTALILRCSPV